MEKMDVIFRQVFIKNLKSKTWLWIVLGPLVLAAIFGAVFWLMNQTNQTTRIGVVSDSPALVQTFKISVIRITPPRLQLNEHWRPKNLMQF